MKKFLNRVFKLDENQTTIKTEIIAGLTTFFAMCYIVIVNPNQMTGFLDIDGASQIWNACFIGGIIAAVIATLCMAFIANKPFALAAGMGLNSFFYVSFIIPCLLFDKETGKIIGTETPLVDGYQAGLVIILISGAIFLILSLTGLRKYIAKSLPNYSEIYLAVGNYIYYEVPKTYGLLTINKTENRLLAIYHTVFLDDKDTIWFNIGSDESFRGWYYIKGIAI